MLIEIIEHVVNINTWSRTLLITVFGLVSVFTIGIIGLFLSLKNGNLIGKKANKYFVIVIAVGILVSVFLNYSLINK